jgi:carbon storage regulator CsrA
MGEEIIIDGNIRVTVVAISASKVRIGITAPSFVAVDRLEVHERREQFADNPAPVKAVPSCP